MTKALTHTHNKTPTCLWWYFRKHKEARTNFSFEYEHVPYSDLTTRMSLMIKHVATQLCGEIHKEKRFISIPCNPSFCIKQTLVLTPYRSYTKLNHSRLLFLYVWQVKIILIISYMILDHLTIFFFFFFCTSLNKMFQMR